MRTALRAFSGSFLSTISESSVWPSARERSVAILCLWSMSTWGCSVADLASSAPAMVLRRKLVEASPRAASHTEQLEQSYNTGPTILTCGWEGGGASGSRICLPRICLSRICLCRIGLSRICLSWILPILDPAYLGKSRQVGGDGKSWSTGYWELG